MESLGRMVAIILAVILLFLFPLRYDALLQKETVESYINQEMEYFFHQITVKHYIDVAMYEEFVQLLSASGDLYSVGIERYVPTIIDETSVDTLDYENVLEQLKTETKVEIETNEYLVLTVHKNSESFYDRLTNLFLPMIAPNEEMTIGGSMQ